MEKAKFKAGELIIDKKLTALRPINAVFVSRYRQAYRYGAAMPPPIMDGKTHRVASGNHRVTAFVQEYGPDHEMDVLVRNFASERELLETFARENAAHGNALDGITRKRMVVALMGEGVTAEDAARIFDISVKKIEQYGAGTVIVIGKKGRKHDAPIKRGLENIAGKEVTAKQYAEHLKADRGVPVAVLAGQITRWLRNGWVSRTEMNVKALNELYNALCEFREKGQEAAA